MLSLLYVLQEWQRYKWVIEWHVVVYLSWLFCSAAAFSCSATCILLQTPPQHCCRCISCDQPSSPHSTCRLWFPCDWVYYCHVYVHEHHVHSRRVVLKQRKINSVNVLYSINNTSFVCCTCLYWNIEIYKQVKLAIKNKRSHIHKAENVSWSAFLELIFPIRAHLFILYCTFRGLNRLQDKTFVMC